MVGLSDECPDSLEQPISFPRGRCAVSRVAVLLVILVLLSDCWLLSFAVDLVSSPRSMKRREPLRPRVGADDRAPSGWSPRVFAAGTSAGWVRRRLRQPRRRPRARQWR